MIPDFGDGGLLPPAHLDGGYGCATQEVEQRFVLDLGSPVWRQQLLQGWTMVRESVGELVPSARWWLWGCFVSNHSDPLWGDDEVLSSLVILPVADLPDLNVTSMMVDSIRAAEARHRVDAEVVFQFAEDGDGFVDYLDELNIKWRPRASKGVADHATRLLVPAGFLEVFP